MTRFLLLLLAAMAAGCANLTPADYAREAPRLDLREFFNGRVDGWGMVQDRDGRVIRRLAVRMDCRWSGDTGTLDEYFTWSDGKTERRTWTIVKRGDRYTGRADDVVGEAVGEAAGNALRWQYTLRLPPDLGGVEVSMDDWMWQLDGGTLANRTRMRKFGIELAEISIFFRKDKH